MIVRPLERDRKDFGVDLAQQGLDRAVLRFDQIVEDEHVVLQRLHEVFVLGLDRLHDPLFHVLLGEVHDTRSRADATNLAGAQCGVGLELALHHLL